MGDRTKVALFGTGFCAGVHMESYARFVGDAEVVAVYGRDRRRLDAFADAHGIKGRYTDPDRMIAEADFEVADVCVPNFMHHGICLKAAARGRHVIMEKPLALTAGQAEEMIKACREAGVLLMYAEELCFAPKYERVRALVAAGAVGEVYMLKQSEKHSGPHSAWFYDKRLSGGGVMMDMGCHALAWFRWMNKGARPVSVYADMKTVLHSAITDAEDNAVTIVEFDNGVTCMAEDSWARHGGMDDRIEVYGTKGVCYADLFQGNAALTYSAEGYDYASEKAGSSSGWSFTAFEEAFNQGYPHELGHFIACVRGGGAPLVTGEDGLAVLGMLNAAYASARIGSKVRLPYEADAAYPMELWKGP
ncbi:MAG: Gfo/Idh/MocA family oxidoreductase [Oscillospiraceae bacterium]|nr:Gfo/Idh/MocA family oxidoreductase [Oscillospiraceae bacterium]